MWVVVGMLTVIDTYSDRCRQVQLGYGLGLHKHLLHR